ncbi:tachykinin-3b [Brachyhypopomus gauderio]|uniref:tachykinin-3b n=1 Tax=Brachyhypopomus gauderio TaxID=698409 RepID=UPI0040433872
MGAGWGLALPWLLLLLLPSPGSAKPALEYVPEQDIGGVLSSRDMRQDDDVDYDSFVGLMGRRSTGTDVVRPIRRNWDIDDIFVGLLGRRSSDSDVPPWRRERFFTKNKTFRSRRGM